MGEFVIYLSIPICILCLYGIKHINEKYDAESPPFVHKVFILTLFLFSLIIPGLIIYEVLSYFDKPQGETALYTYIIFYLPYLIFIINFSTPKKD
jgi:hypothetical protein